MVLLKYPTNGIAMAVKLVSIVIPCFNLGQYLEDAIESVESQTSKDWELIVVDDGSTEASTVEAIEKIEKEKVHKVIRQKNSGLAGAKNTGIKHAKGKYIVCLDADDMLAPDYLKKTTKKIEKSSQDVAFVSTWLQEFGVRKNIWKSSEYNTEDILVNNVVHAASLFKKSIWEEVGGFKKMDIGGYEDWDFWLSIIEKDYKWEVIKEPLFYYRIREGSMLSGAKADHTEIYKDLFRLHPKLFKENADNLIIRDADEMRQLHYAIGEKNKAIADLEKYEDEVLELREQVFKLRDELNSMKNSRVLGKVIKTREFVGSSRKALVAAPKKGFHKTRVVAAPFVPRPARLAIKKLANKALRDVVQLDIPVKFVHNQKWDKNLPLISVVVPYYNHGHTIDETLESLGSQSFTNFEVLIVNDGSTDPRSIDKLKELDFNNLTARVIHQENAGVAVARNTGVSRSKGKYVICLDSDDMLEQHFIEKCTVVLETDADAAFMTTHRQDFGVINSQWENIEFNADDLMRNNMVITAAEYRKVAWEDAGGYKSGIGYEDWEFWINLTEKGWWGRLIPETLFRYRTSLQSRYVEDKDTHWRTMKELKTLHPNYRKNIKRLLKSKQTEKLRTLPGESFINMNHAADYIARSNKKPNVLMALPWMTFGGAETLIINFSKELCNQYNLDFVTGLNSKHEWEYKFQEISRNIYHLPNLFDSEDHYADFISNYVTTRKIDILHIIHTSVFFAALPTIKEKHPNLRIVVTVFNDRAEHFYRAVENEDWIDVFSTDNNSVKDHYKKVLTLDRAVQVIPNGINCYDIYNPALFDRKTIRGELGLLDNDLAIFFIGRLSEEKNPDVFCEVAKELVGEKNLKFFLIGDGPAREEVEKRVKNINSNSLTYLGYKSEVAEYLSAADIFVLPSSIEGFPLSILEAMAMKVAVVASDVGAVSEIIEPGIDGIIVEPGSATEITDAITTLANNPKLLAKVKGNAREKVNRKYSNIILGENYKKLYKDLAK